MAPTMNDEGQFELFDRAAPIAPHRGSRPGVLSLQVRADQLFLIGIGLLIGSTIVFAVGVERGKQLVRGERSLLTRPTAVSPSEAPAHSETSAVIEAPEEAVSATEATTEPTETQVERALRETTPRYAIQVVTYSRPRLAQQELERLRASGEAAFLVTRNGSTVLYVGPFPSKTDAQQKRVSLKRRYHDCFVRLL